MFNRVYLILCVVVLYTTAENHDWDLAVVINDQIELLQSNGTLIGSTLQQFTQLKALTFDNVRHEFVVSDMNQMNDTIFTVQLTKETGPTPIIQDLPDDVQGLAIDPIEDVLYWTDLRNHSINYVELNKTKLESKTLMSFIDENPQDIAIDICKRYIYWTNSNLNNPSIERARLDGSEHEILIDSDLYLPAGIAIDYKNQRLYWADMREGIYYRIESTNLEGKEREIILEGTHLKPFGIAVDDQSIYWTDINNNALWRIPKYDIRNQPERLREFNEKPLGLIVKDVEIKSLPDCQNLAEIMKNYNGSTVEVYRERNDDDDKSVESVTECLNGGEIQDGYCKCLKGFVGKNCEISVCHNFCLHGHCRLSTLGYPQCRCPKGFVGSRCERDVCDGFCLNDGDCIYENALIPKCRCRNNFVGVRCETSMEIADLCNVFCKDKENDVLISRNNQSICRCEKGSFTVSKSNLTMAELLMRPEESSVYFTRFQDPSFIIMSGTLLIMCIIIIVLSVLVCSLRRRPRIKKRIVVNKNITPLTYRPQPTEQCEITIEDCCNMNVCETPCFEPPQFVGCPKNKTDDKKTLLANMENGDEVY